MASFIFTGGRFLDPRQDALRDGMEVLVEDGIVREVSDRPITAAAATRIALGGRTLMPGLIDAHIHVVLTEVNRRAARGHAAHPARRQGLGRDAGDAAARLHHAARHRRRRFRHEGGGDEGVFPRSAPVHRRPADQPDRRPRRFPARARRRRSPAPAATGCSTPRASPTAFPRWSRRCARSCSKGADHIKIMVSGGVASQADPLESLQYRVDEIEAAVEEATRWGSYVCAHAYSAKAIERAVRAGVRMHRARQPDRRADRGADGGDAAPMSCRRSSPMIR